VSTIRPTIAFRSEIHMMRKHIDRVPLALPTSSSTEGCIVKTALVRNPCDTWRAGAIAIIDDLSTTGFT
jgi:hypothetical protein